MTNDKIRPTINPHVIMSVLFSSSVDSHAGIPACITNLCTVQSQQPATRQHLGGRRNMHIYKQTHPVKAITNIRGSHVTLGKTGDCIYRHREYFISTNTNHLFAGTCMPGEMLVTGPPSLSHVRLGRGTPMASHASLTASFTTTVTVPPRLEMTGGTERHKKERRKKLRCCTIAFGWNSAGCWSRVVETCTYLINAQTSFLKYEIIKKVTHRAPADFGISQQLQQRSLLHICKSQRQTLEPVQSPEPGHASA